MGSLGSRPSVPQQTQTVSVAAPTASTLSAAANVDQSTTEANTAQTVSEERAQSLLGRERGRFGTINTSFRGLLGLSNNVRPHKTLLGE